MGEVTRGGASPGLLLISRFLGLVYRAQSWSILRSLVRVVCCVWHPHSCVIPPVVSCFLMPLSESCFELSNPLVFEISEEIRRLRASLLPVPCARCCWSLLFLCRVCAAQCMRQTERQRRRSGGLPVREESRRREQERESSAHARSDPTHRLRVLRVTE